MFEWIVGLVEEGGYLGIFLLMFAENLFPPIPSELIMPLVGFVASRGELNPYLGVVVGTAGSLLGACFWYYIGQQVGSGRLKRWAVGHGRLLTLTPEDVDRACEWFDRHGGWAVSLGRLVPAVRSLISVPAGIAGMSLRKFLFFSALGTTAWTTLLSIAGYLLGEHYRQVPDWTSPITQLVIGGLVGWYLYRVIAFRAPR